MDKVLLMGGGKYAGLLYSFFKDQFDFYGYLDDVYETAYVEEVYGLKKIGKSEDADTIISRCPNMVIAIGAERDVAARKRYYDLFKKSGFKFPRLIHASVQMFTDITNIGDGVVIQPGVIIDPQVVIGENCVISRASVIGHDGHIGRHTYIAPGVLLNGSTSIGEECFIGTGSVVIQKRKIGNNVMIGASSCVISDIPDHQVAVGVPAKVKA